MKQISYSAIIKFSNCRRAYKYLYVDNLVPIVISEALSFGTLWHEVLADTYESAEQQQSFIPPQGKNYAQLLAMSAGYLRQYQDHFKVLAVELPFEIYIRPPHAGRAMRGVRFKGIIDLVIERDDGIWIVEHKTARTIDGKYLSKLWHDFQIMLYAYAYQELTGKKVQGIIYNIVKKSQIKQGAGETNGDFNARVTAALSKHNKETLQRVGETETEYQRRYQEACAKSQNNKSSAKRKMPETDEEFQERVTVTWEKRKEKLTQKLPEPDELFLKRLMLQYENPEMFHRQEILCTDRGLREVKKELWEMARAMKSTDYYKNRAQCNVYGECEYFKICRSGENPLTTENHYKEREKNVTNKEDGKSNEF